MSAETYSAEELSALVDALMGVGHVRGVPDSAEGFRCYFIRGIYVSPEVVEQAIVERLEAILKV